MIKNKYDQRYQNTEKQIKLVLGERDKQDFVGVTVTEICRRAKIKRSTFYRHYDSLEGFIKSIQNAVKDDFEMAIKGDEEIFGIFYDLLQYVHDERMSFRAIGDYQRLFQDILVDLRPFITKNWNCYQSGLNDQIFCVCRGALTSVIVYWFDETEIAVKEIKYYAMILTKLTDYISRSGRCFVN